MPRVPGVTAVPRGDFRDRCDAVTLRPPLRTSSPGSDMLHSRPRRRTPGTVTRCLLAGVVAGTVVLTGVAPAAAVPTPPPNPTD